SAAGTGQGATLALPSVRARRYRTLEPDGSGPQEREGVDRRLLVMLLTEDEPHVAGAIDHQGEGLGGEVRIEARMGEAFLLEMLDASGGAGDERRLRLDPQVAERVVQWHDLLQQADDLGMGSIGEDVALVGPAD